MARRMVGKSIFLALACSEMAQLVEGMSIMSYENGSLSYFDDALQAEINITTSAIPAETSAGGMRMNSILRDGGNVWSGAIFIGGTDGKWQSENVDDALRQRGIQAANKTAHVQQFNMLESETFLTTNVGGGLKFFRGGDARNWGWRGDYRLVIVNSKSDAVPFFARSKRRMGHRISVGMFYTLRR